ncbi:MAG: hypothetical protein RSD47_00800 [Romboutsia sp.]
MKNRTIVLILMIGIFILGVGMGTKINRLQNEKQVITSTVKPNKDIKVKRILRESTKDFKLNKGEVVTEYTDGSFTLVNEKSGLYEFQPCELGDWNYKVKNQTELDKIVKTYLSIKNTGEY